MKLKHLLWFFEIWLLYVSFSFSCFLFFSFFFHSPPIFYFSLDLFSPFHFSSISNISPWYPSFISPTFEGVVYYFSFLMLLRKSFIRWRVFTACMAMKNEVVAKGTSWQELFTPRALIPFLLPPPNPPLD